MNRLFQIRNPRARHALRKSLPAMSEAEIAALGKPGARSDIALFFATFASAFVLFYAFIA